MIPSFIWLRRLRRHRDRQFVVFASGSAAMSAFSSFPKSAEMRESYWFIRSSSSSSPQHKTHLTLTTPVIGFSYHSQSNVVKIPCFFKGMRKLFYFIILAMQRNTIYLFITTIIYLLYMYNITQKHCYDLPFF